MNDYTELVKALRAEACNPFSHIEDARLMCRAADAIEELTRAVDALSNTVTTLQQELAHQKEAMPKWIPVDEEFPCDEDPVLVARKFLGVKDVPPSVYVEIAEVIDGFWHADSDEYKITPRRHPVFAWMPLPEPPKEETTDG